MNRKPLVCLLVLMVLFTLLPTVGVAKEELYVTLEGYCTLDADTPRVDYRDGYALLDVQKRTLILDNFAIARKLFIEGDIRIVIRGACGFYPVTSTAIYVAGNVTLCTDEPGSSLVAHSYDGDAIIVDGLTVESGMLRASAEKEPIAIGGAFVMNGGEVHATGENDPGISCSGDMTMNGGELYATSKNEEGFLIAGQLVMNGGELMATGEKDLGLSVYSNVTLNGGTLTATSQKDDGLSCNVSGLTINGGTLVTKGAKLACHYAMPRITSSYYARTNKYDQFTFHAPAQLFCIESDYFEVKCIKALCTLDGKTTYHGTFEEAWQTAQNADCPATIKLTGSSALAHPHAIDGGEDITLDLNGWTLDASASTEQAGIFHVKDGGAFTLTDSKTTNVAKQGKLTGGNKQVTDQLLYGGAVTVDYGGAFTMNGGVLLGNIASDGGAVSNGGTFVMNGGSIQENQAYQGGGVFNYGTFTMNGGQIIGNTAAIGGGVFQAGGDCTLQGESVISGNTAMDDGSASNLYLDWDQAGGGDGVTFTIGNMGENAKVYLSTKKQPGSTETPVVVSAPNAVVAAADLAKYHSDDPTYCLQLWGEDGRAYLNVHYIAQYQTPEALVSAATCTQNAVYRKSCNSCGLLLEETFVAENTMLPHLYPANYTAESADSKQHYVACLFCGHQDFAQAHIWNLDAATETESKHCTVCGYVAQAATGHLHVSKPVPAVAPTCTKAGASAHYLCTCGACFEDAACTKPIEDIGTWAYLPATGHTWATEPLMERSDAIKHYFACKTCGELDSGMPHTWNVVTATLHTDKHCTLCGYVAEKQLEHIHVGQFVLPVSPTCTQSGAKGYYTCACGLCFVDAACMQPIADLDAWKVVPATGHRFSSDHFATDALMHYPICMYCGLQGAGQLHTWTGEGADTHCSVCGYLRSTAPAVPATGDGTPLALCFALLALSGAGLMIVTHRRKPKRRHT